MRMNVRYCEQLNELENKATLLCEAVKRKTIKRETVR